MPTGPQDVLAHTPTVLIDRFARRTEENPRAEEHAVPHRRPTRTDSRAAGPGRSRFRDHKRKQGDTTDVNGKIAAVDGRPGTYQPFFAKSTGMV